MAYNKKVSIGSVSLLAKQYADRVIVVDDGNSDRTDEVVAIARLITYIRQVDIKNRNIFPDVVLCYPWLEMRLKVG